MSGITSSGSLRRLVADPAHGPLPALMLVLTVLTGLVDAVSILSLGRVFVANMTGNVVFVGFALAGASGFSLSASLSALAGFLVGAAVVGLAGERVGAHRGRQVAGVAGAQLLLLVSALLISVFAGTPPASADVRHRDRFAVIRRLLAVVAMFAGAVTGTLLVLHVSDAAALGLAVCLLAIVVAAAIASSRVPASWHAPRP